MSKSGSYLGDHGYTIYKECLGAEDLLFLRRHLTVQPKIYGSPVQPDSFTIFLENEKKIYIPRFLGYKEFGPPDEIRMHQPEVISCNFAGKLRDYQLPIVNKYMKALSNDGGGGLLDIPCGYGKTACALNIISKLCVKTLVIVHKSFLLDQWVERIGQFLPTAKIGKIQGQVIDVEGCDIVIGMLQSLCMKRYPQSVFNGFGLVVVDECHHIPSEVFSRAMLRVVTKYTLGLSATMTRKDGLTPVLKMFLGDVVYKLPRAKNCNVLAKTIEFQCTDDNFLEPVLDFRGKECFSNMITKLCNFEPRTEFIYKVICEEFKQAPSQQMLVLSQNKSLLVNLNKKIEKKAVLSSGYYVGGMKREDLEQSENKQVILATYGMAAEGLDIVGLTTLLLATPRTDIVQAVGRILRTKHNRPLVLDIVDPHQVFQSQSKKRNKYYKKNGYVIEHTDSVCYPNSNRNSTSRTSSKCLIDISDLTIEDDNV